MTLKRGEAAGVRSGPKRGAGLVSRFLSHIGTDLDPRFGPLQPSLLRARNRGMQAARWTGCRNLVAGRRGPLGVSSEGMPTSALTERQRAVLDCRLAGKTYQETADELGISIQTVKPHLRNIARKLGVVEDDGRPSVDVEALRAAAARA